MDIYATRPQSDDLPTDEGLKFTRILAIVEFQANDAKYNVFGF